MPVYFPGQTIVSGRQETGTVLSNLLNAYDPDAAAFFTAAGITDDAQKDAINTMVVDLKAASLWSPMLALYPFVGGNATAHSINLKNPAQYQSTWSGTVTHNANGVTGDGVTGYGNTGFDILSTTANSLCFGAYSRLEQTDGAPLISAVNVGGTTAQIHARYLDNNYYVDNANDSTGRVTGASDGSTGLFTSSRVASNDHRAYRNGAQRGSTNTGAQGTLATASFLLLSYNALLFSANNLALAFVADGFTPTQNADFDTIVQAYQTALGRAV